MSVEQVVGVLAAHGRHVSPETIRHELDGLGGLSDQDATTTLLACYGISPDGTPNRTFAPDAVGNAGLRRVVRSSRAAFAFTTVTATLMIIPMLVVPFGMRFFVDRYLVAGKQTIGPFMILGLVWAAVVVTALVALQFAVLRRSYLRMSAVGQTGFAWHVLRMRVDDLGAQQPGQIIARMNAEQRLAFSGGTLLPVKVVDVVSVIAFAAALAALDLPMFAATLLTGMLVVLASLVVLRSRAGVQVHNDDAMSALSGSVSQLLGAMESVKAAAWEQFAFARLFSLRSRMAATFSTMAVANQWLVFIPGVGLALGLGSVLAIGTWQVIQGTLSLGTLVAAQSFVAMFLESLGGLVYVGSLTQSLSSAASQSNAVLQTPLDPEALEPVTAEPVTALAGDVRLQSVSFGYDRDAPALIDALDVHIPAGRRVALVGTSGSGKTTIARLVTGELRPWSGHVEFDGIPRLQIPRRVKAQHVAYVPQQAVLFAGTIRDNLTLWNDAVEDEDVRRAAQDACIEATILARPGGYFAQITGDGGFSGGERQRLAIARALVSNPKVLILDEATSALDPVVEVEVEHNLRRRGCTCLVVAHRLSTVRDADEILVIRAGRVVQRGRFDDIKHEGLFAELIHG